MASGLLSVGVDRVSVPRGAVATIGGSRIRGRRDQPTFQLAQLDNGEIAAGMVSGEVRAFRRGPDVVLDELNINADTGEISGGGRLHIFGGEVSIGGNVNSTITSRVRWGPFDFEMVLHRLEEDERR